MQKNKKNIWLLADQCLISGTHFLLNLLLIRWLGVELFGMFASLEIMWLMVVACSQSMITVPMFSLYPKMQAEYKHYFQQLALWQLLFIGLCVVLLSIGFVLSHSVYYIEYIGEIIIPFTLVLSQLLIYDYTKKWFFVKREFRYIFCVDFLVAALEIIGLGYLYINALGSIEWILAVLMIAYTPWLLNYIWHFFYSINKKSIQLVLQGFVNVAKIHWEYAKWMLASTFVQWFSGNYFLIAGAAIVGTGALGVIRLAQNTMGFLHIIFQVMENSIPIQAANILHEKGKIALNNYLKHTTLYWGKIIGIMLLVLSLPASIWLYLLYGAEQMQWYWIIWWFSGIYIVIFLNHPLRFWLRSHEITQPFFWAYAFSAAFSLLTANFLLNHLELVGMLLGLLLTQLISSCVFIFTIKRRMIKRVEMVKM